MGEITIRIYGISGLLDKSEEVEREIVNRLIADLFKIEKIYTYRTRKYLVFEINGYEAEARLEIKNPEIFCYKDCLQFSASLAELEIRLKRSNKPFHEYVWNGISLAGKICDYDRRLRERGIDYIDLEINYP